MATCTQQSIEEQNHYSKNFNLKQNSLTGTNLFSGPTLGPQNKETAKTEKDQPG